MSLHTQIAMTVTRFRHARAVHSARDLGDGPLDRLRCHDPGREFHIVGAGPSLADLRDDDFRRIASGTSAAVGLAGLAPAAFDILAIDETCDTGDVARLAAKARCQDRPALIWAERRLASRMPDTGIPVHAYRGVAVPVGGRLSNFVHVYRNFLRHQVFDDPDLGVAFDLGGPAARLVLLACALGYRRICFAGLDTGGAAGRGGGPAFADLLAALMADRGDALRFEVMDPAGRSDLTPLLAGRRAPDDPAVLLERARQRR